MPLPAHGDHQPPLVRGWSAKVVVPSQTLGEDYKVSVCNISSSGLQQLASDLRGKKARSEKIDLRYNYLSPQDAAVLGEGILGNSRLRSLDLRNNEIGDAGVESLCKVFIAKELHVEEEVHAKSQPRSRSRISVLRVPEVAVFQDFEVQPDLESKSKAVLAKAPVIARATLQELNVNSNDLGDAAAECLSRWLKDSSMLHKLRLRDNRITAEGARHISDALRINRSLRLLELGLNDVHDEGCTYLAEALMASSTVHSLDLGSNGLTSAGMEALSEALHKNCALQKLDLRINRIRDDGVTELAEALEDNFVLRELDLSGNSVRDESRESLAELVLCNTHLQRLVLEDNFLTDAFGKEILKMLERAEDSQLIELDLGENDVSDLMQNQLSLFLRTQAVELQKRRRSSSKTRGSKERSHSISHGHSKERRDSRSHSRSHSRSKSRSKSKDRRGSRSHSRSKSKDRRGSRSKSKEQRRSGSHSRSKSKEQRTGSRSRGPTKDLRH